MQKQAQTFKQTFINDKFIIHKIKQILITWFISYMSGYRFAVHGQRTGQPTVALAQCFVI